MTRQRIDDPHTPGLYVRVNWRKPDEMHEDDLPYVQLSTHNERADDPGNTLLLEAHGLLSFMASVTRSGEALSVEDEERLAGWFERLGKFRSELTGTYVHLEPATMRDVLKTLHKANRQTWPPALASIPTQVALEPDDLDPH